MKLLVGLGNPGDKYKKSRHNVGFSIVDAIARQLVENGWARKFQGRICQCIIDCQKVLILKPETFMNNSGHSILEATHFYKISPSDIIVFHDDLDLQPGQIAFKSSGGHAGHNGLRSIHQTIGPDYKRVRIGIGHPGNRDQVAQYVLSDFCGSERRWLDPLIEKFVEEIHLIISWNTDKLFGNKIVPVTVDNKT